MWNRERLDTSNICTPTTNTHTCITHSDTQKHGQKNQWSKICQVLCSILTVLSSQTHRQTVPSPRPYSYPALISLHVTVAHKVWVLDNRTSCHSRRGVTLNSDWVNKRSMRRFKSAARQGGFVMIQHREKAGPDIDHQSVPNWLEGNYSGYLSGKKYIT